MREGVTALKRHGHSGACGGGHCFREETSECALGMLYLWL